MYSTKTLLAAASLAVMAAAGIGSASAAPWDNRFGDRHHDVVVRREVVVNRPVVVRERIVERRPVVVQERIVERRPVVMRERVYETLRFHHFRAFGEPYFLHGRYVVKSHDRFGRPVLVEINPQTGAFIGLVRI